MTSINVSGDQNHDNAKNLNELGIQVIPVAIDVALDEVEKLTACQPPYHGGIDVHFGVHPYYGRCHIIITPIGDCLILPVS